MKKLFLLIEILFYLTIPLIWILETNPLVTYLLIGNISIRLICYKTKKKITDNRCECPNILNRINFNVFMSREEQQLKLRTDWILDIEKIKERLNMKGD